MWLSWKLKMLHTLAEVEHVTWEQTPLLHCIPFPFTSLSYSSINYTGFTWRQAKMIRNVLLPVKFWKFDTLISYHSCTETNACCLKDWSLNSISILSHFFLLFRFGKHKKDDGGEDRLDRKGSSKSRLGDVRAVEETQHMRLEHERWGTRQCHGKTLDWDICKPPN